MLVFLVLLLGGLWVAGYAVASGRTPADASVDGVDIGGIAPQAAVARLEDELGARASAPIQATVAGTEVSLAPADYGLGLDAAQTVRDSGSRSWNPVSIVRHLTGGADIDPAVRVDEQALDAGLAGLATDVAREPRDGGVTFDGVTPVAVAPVAGVSLDRDGAAQALREAYLRTDAPVEMPATEPAPAIDAADVQAALRTLAQPAVSAPVVLRAGGTDVPASPAVIAAATSLVPQGGTLALSVDGAKLKAALAGPLADLESAPRDARVRISGGEPVVVPAVAGRQFTVDALAKAVLPALTKAGGARVAAIATTVTQPELTTAEVQALGVTEKLSSFTQRFPYAAYRVTNIGEAARRINGTLLLPGQTFSMNATTKERTVANGYTTGTVIDNGRYRQELGGGVSTITTAVWTAAFYAGLERVEQRAHSLYISRYQAGLEATVNWPDLDLKFRNDAGTGVLVQADSGQDYVTITIWGTKRYDIDAVSGPRVNVRQPTTVYDTASDCTPQSGVEGFDITVTRVFTQRGEVVRREPLRTSYNATNDVVCGAAP